jgi:hypothetical protein
MINRRYLRQYENRVITIYRTLRPAGSHFCLYQY